MRRGTSKSSGFFGLGDIVLIIVFAGAGIIAAVPYVITATYYLFPAWLFWLRHRSPQSLVPPVFDAVAPEDAENELSEAENNLSEAEQEVESILSEGQSEGVRYLINQDRFENRSNLGQSLNKRLADAREQVRYFESQVELCREPYQATCFAWQTKVTAWHKQFSYLRALQLSFIAFAIVVVIEEIKNFGQSNSRSILVFNPLPVVLRPSTVTGTTVAWIVGMITLFAAKWAYANRSMQFIAQKLEELNTGAKNPHEHRDEQEFASSNSEENEQSDEVEQTYNWYEILEVSPQASNEEIKKAYKQAISRCHPDTVQGRSKTIREAALKESQMVNSAYAEARRLRGF